MLGPAGVVVDDDVAVDVGERACALTIGVAGERARRMPAQQGRAGEGSHRRVGFGPPEELSDGFAPKVVNQSARDQLRALRRQTSRPQTLNHAARSRFTRICLTQRGHHRPPSEGIVLRYRSTISMQMETIQAVAGEPSDEDYRRLLELRTGLRRFLRWSEQHARSAGLPPAQHQLLLAIRGHRDPRGPTVGDVADHLLLRHHSAVGLVDRAESAGLIAREQDADNHSVVRLRLTERGTAQLEALSEQHLEELAHLAPTMHALWDALEEGRAGDSGSARHPAAPPLGSS